MVLTVPPETPVRWTISACATPAGMRKRTFSRFRSPIPRRRGLLVAPASSLGSISGLSIWTRLRWLRTSVLTLSIALDGVCKETGFVGGVDRRCCRGAVGQVSQEKADLLRRDTPFAHLAREPMPDRVRR